MRTPLRYTRLSEYLWSKFSCFLMFRAAGPYFLYCWRNFQILCRHIWSWTKPTLLGIRMTPAASQSTLSLGNYIPYWISYVSKKSAQTYGYLHISRKEFLYFYIPTNSEEPLKKLKTCRVSFLGPEGQNCPLMSNFLKSISWPRPFKGKELNELRGK